MEIRTEAVVLCVIIFVITFAETLVATWEGRADRQSTSSKTNKFSKKAAHWATVFEAILFVDIVLVAREGWFLLAPILAGAWIGKFWACERRRKKWRARVNTPAQKPVDEEEEA